MPKVSFAVDPLPPLTVPGHRRSHRQRPPSPPSPEWAQFLPPGTYERARPLPIVPLSPLARPPAVLAAAAAAAAPTLPHGSDSRSSLSNNNGGGGSQDNANGDARDSEPRWALVLAYVALFVALIAVSSAATFLRKVKVPAVSKAAQRMQITVLLQMPGFVVQVVRGRSEHWATRGVVTNPAFVARIAVAGLALAAHFGLWITSLDHTSLTHSLLLVTTHSIVMVVAMWALRLSRIMPSLRVSPGETIGTLVGFVGLALVAQDIEADSEVTLKGDALAFAGGIAMIFYLLIGADVRKQVPLFVYAFPVTLVAAVILSLAAIPFDYDYVASASGWGIFSWLWVLPNLWLMVYIGAVPGILGHTGLNFSLKWVSSLVVSVTLMTEPLVGTLIGMLFQESDMPGKWTFIGAPILILGSIATTISAHVRQTADQTAESLLTSDSPESPSLSPSASASASASPSSLVGDSHGSGLSHPHPHAPVLDPQTDLA